MEYERALFRVYDRSLESLRMDQPMYPGRCGNRVRPTTVCFGVEMCLLGSALLGLLLLSVAHVNYVGSSSPNCLHDELSYLQHLSQEAWDADAHVNATMPFYPLLDKNAVLQLKVGPRGTREQLEEVYAKWAVNHTNTSDISEGNATASLGPPALYGAGDGEFAPEYRFTQNPPLLYLKEGFIKNHDVTVLNVTLSQSCLTKGGSSALALTLGVLGHDTVVVNQLFQALPRVAGVLENSASGEQWGWTSSLLPPKAGRDFGSSLAFKCGVIFQTCLAFFFTATVTALVVRMLISSGVVIMFPLFACLQSLGFRELDMQILTLSYPWLGLPVELLRRQRKPSGPLIGAHCIRVVVLYSMYEACQLAWSAWLYDRPLPDGLQLEVFALIMVWEYFAMIYLRSYAALFYLPKFTFLYFAAFHCYFYANAYGFAGVALGVSALLTAHAMCHAILHFELPASVRLEVSFESPRAFFVELPWPAWHASLPPSWTLFLPLNARPRTIYDDDDNAAAGAAGNMPGGGAPVPPGGGGAGANGAGEGAGSGGGLVGRLTARRSRAHGGSDDDDEEMGGVEMRPMNSGGGSSSSSSSGAASSSSSLNNRVTPAEASSGSDEEPELSGAGRRRRRVRQQQRTGSHEGGHSSSLAPPTPPDSTTPERDSETGFLVSR